MTESTDQHRRTFLTGEWRYLAMLNYRVDAAVLAPHVPSGVELDTWRGEALVSVVGFRFLNTRLLGVPALFHRHFPEVNLRFYVRREIGGEVRRGVTFVREIVPRPAIAATARLLYNEPYVALPMQVSAPTGPGQTPGRVVYAWQSGGGWNHMALRPTGEPQPLAEGSEEQFITEHYWGYTRQRDGGTTEYQVAHPRWRVWQAVEAEFCCDVAGLYGPQFVEALSSPPTSAFLADGSEIAVYMPRRVA
ncbi:MAG: DUF2071 domain-containing protein [Anaerolineae bacterium]